MKLIIYSVVILSLLIGCDDAVSIDANKIVIPTTEPIKQGKEDIHGKAKRDSLQPNNFEKLTKDIGGDDLKSIDELRSKLGGRS